jgi:hypothetical protein
VALQPAYEWGPGPRKRAHFSSGLGIESLYAVRNGSELAALVAL